MSHMYWGKMLPGHVGLYHFDGKSRMMCKADGSFGAAGIVEFATLEEAESYARRYIEVNPARGCRIYDRSGDCAGEFRGAEVPAQRYTRSQAKRDLFIGLMGFLVIPLGFLFDVWVGWGLFLGMALATKCVMLGVMKLSDGIAGLMESKSNIEGR